MRRNNSSRKSHHSESASSFTSLYSNCKQKEPIISIEKEETKNYSYNTFLQRMERLITKNENITEFPMSTLKKEMQMMKSEDVELYVQQMLKEKKNINLYLNENDEQIIKLYTKTICEACISTSFKCIRCGQKICDLHSPDSEEKQSKRHCPTCFEKQGRNKKKKT